MCLSTRGIYHVCPSCGIALRSTYPGLYLNCECGSNLRVCLDLVGYPGVTGYTVDTWIGNELKDKGEDTI